MSDNTQNKPTKEDSERNDEYGGKYKPVHEGLSEAQKFGTEQLPVQEGKTPFKDLKAVGG